MMKKIFLLILSTLLWSIVNTGLQAKQKAILIGIDGVQYERLQAINSPNFDRLYKAKAYTGGVTGQGSQQSTKSGPGWATILTGVWADKHQVTSNGSGLSNPQFPSLFKRLKDAKPAARIASIVHWSPINTQYFTNELREIESVKSGLSDSQVVTNAVTFIQNGGDFIFVHLDDPDTAGHSSGFGANYNQKLAIADQQLGQLLNAVENIQQTTGDDWLVLVTTDHGRETSGYGHGDQSASEKTIFIASNKPLNQEFSEHVSSLPNQEFSGIYGYPAQTSITPTILQHMNVQMQRQWLLDGHSLIGDLGARKLMASTQENQIHWYSDDTGVVDVYRNNQLVSQVNADVKSWNDVNYQSGTNDYSFVLNGVAMALRKSTFNITAGLDWNSSRAYFFRSDNRYVRYSKTLDRADSGYPATTNNGNWPGLGRYANKIVASFKKNTAKSYFFLNDGRYLRYDNLSDKVDLGYPQNITHQSWPGMGDYANQIVATLRWSGDKVFFFLKNGTYLRFDLGNDRVDAGYPKAVNRSTWPGLQNYAEKITAAVKWSDNRAYFFLQDKQYIRYSISNDATDQGYPKGTNNTSWPGLLNP